MTAAGRRLRVGATLGVALLLVAGTLAGSDDWFPVGPFRMYATASKPTGRVGVAELKGVTADGATRAVRPGEVGLRRAELEGRMPALRSDPALLGALAATFGRRWPEEPPLVELRVEIRARSVVDRVVQPGDEVRTVARWVAG